MEHLDRNLRSHCPRTPSVKLPPRPPPSGRRVHLPREELHPTFSRGPAPQPYLSTREPPELFARLESLFASREEARRRTRNAEVWFRNTPIDHPRFFARKEVFDKEFERLRRLESYFWEFNSSRDRREFESPISLQTRWEHERNERVEHLRRSWTPRSVAEECFYPRRLLDAEVIGIAEQRFVPPTVSPGTQPELSANSRVHFRKEKQ